MYSSYMSILSLSGLQTVHPILVLVISCLRLFALLLIVLASYVTVVQSGFLLHLGLPYWSFVGRGIVPCIPIMGPHPFL